MMFIIIIASLFLTVYAANSDDFCKSYLPESVEYCDDPSAILEQQKPPCDTVAQVAKSHGLSDSTQQRLKSLLEKKLAKRQKRKCRENLKERKEFLEHEYEDTAQMSNEDLRKLQDARLHRMRMEGCIR